MRLNFDKPHEYVIRRIGGKRDEVLQNSLFIDKHSIHSIVPTLKKALLQLMLDGTLWIYQTWPFISGHNNHSTAAANALIVQSDSLNHTPTNNITH